MSDHLDTQNKKLEILACNDHIAIDFAYKALKSALKRSDDKVLNEFELVARTTRISDTVALVKNTPKSKSFAALISFPNERSPRNISTGEKTIAKATIVAFTKEAEILAKIEAGTEHINSDLSWRVICAQLIRELEATTKEAVAEGVAKGKKAHKVRPPSLTHSSIISRKLKDNKYLANKKITEVQYADFFDAFNEKEIHDIRKNNPGIKIIAHPECPPEVIKASDFAGSTSGMIKYVQDNQPKKVMMVTECSMSDNIQVENPNVDFIKPCNMCPHMKKITLPKILDCLQNETGEIIMDKETIEKARISVEKMAAIGR